MRRDPAEEAGCGGILPSKTGRRAGGEGVGGTQTGWEGGSELRVSNSQQAHVVARARPPPAGAQGPLRPPPPQVPSSLEAREAASSRRASPRREAVKAV